MVMELETAEEDRDRFFTISLDMLCIAGFDGYFKRLNPAWERTLGFTTDELLAEPFLTFVHPDDRDRTAAEAASLAAGNDTIRFENRHLCKDGSYRWLLWTATPEPGRGLIYAAARDVTESRKAQEELQRLYRQMERVNERLEENVLERSRELRDARNETLERLALAAERRDDDTGDHIRRVGDLSGLLAHVLELPGGHVELIGRAAPLHDVGKIGIPDGILLKPGKLTSQEFDEMKSHAAIGAHILGGSSVPLLQTAEEIALSHHERWDGSGYPSGLRGEAIPLSGRIVTVADVFDALTRSRPYKEAWPVDMAIEEIKNQRGRHFDPDVVDAFLTVRDAVSRPAGARGQSLDGEADPLAALA
jgi:PAS domain S-box-containing protein